MSDAQFLKSQAQVAEALSKLVQAFDEKTRTSAFISASVYQRRTEPGAQDMIVLATEHTVHDLEPHKDFVDRNIINQRILLQGTSAGEAMQSRKTLSHSASGYRADHYCLNLHVAETASQPDSIVQMVFKTSHKKTLPDMKVCGETLLQAFKNSALKKKLSSFIRTYGDNIDAFVQQPVSQHRQVILMFCDISGFRKIFAAAGWQQAAQMSHALHDIIASRTTTHGGELIRSEGDGFWVGFPVTDFDETERRQLMIKTVMPVAKGIIEDYTRIKQSSALETIRASHIKISLAWSDMTATVQNSRYQKGIIDGQAFLTARTLLEQAPRDRDIILQEPAVSRMHAGLKNI